MHFCKGQRIKVVLPLGDSTGANTVKQFEGKVTVIKDVNVIHKGKSTLGYEYTLLGCKTDWGLDYHFCEEWLMPTSEGETE